MWTRFSEFVNKTWDAKKFCHSLAEKASNKACSLIEMAMGTEEIETKMPVMYDKDDWAFLSQFPPDIWKEALNWRHNEGLRDMFRNYKKSENDIPGGHDWTNEVKFNAPHGHGKKWIFKTPGNDIYIGLTELAHKLTSPPKTHAAETSTHEHWKGAGPGLRDIDPNQTDPNHPQHISKYRHGLYNFDLANIAEVTDQDIDEMSDQQVQSLLKWPLDEKDVKDPEVQKAIKKTRNAMKKVKKHTANAYAFPQMDTTAEGITNWIKANALPEQILGEHPKEIEDPITGEKKQVTYKKANEIYGHWGTPKNPFEHEIPTMAKTINFFELDPKEKTLRSMSKNVNIPVLPRTRALPLVKPTLHQRNIMAMSSSNAAKEGWNWNPDTESYASAIKRLGSKFRNASSINDFKRVIQFWNIWTPEQKEEIKKNARDLFHVGRTVWGKSKETEDPTADPQNVYAIGHRPNYKSVGQGKLDLDPEQMEAFIQEYRPKIFAELFGDKTPGKQGEESKGKLDKYLAYMKKSGNYAPEVIDAMIMRAESLAIFATYYLLTWLNDPLLGIKDPKFGLLAQEDESEIDPETNEQRRIGKMQNFLRSVAQIGFNDVLSRRRRERYGVAKISSLDAPVGDTGKSGAGEVASGQKGKVQHLDDSAVRRWLHSDPSSAARAGQHVNKIAANTEEFFATKRNFILQKLGGSAYAKNDLTNAEKKIDVAVKTSIQLYTKYNEELASKYPDPKDADKKEEAVMKLVHDNLPTAIANMGNYSGTEMENILAKIKNISGMGAAQAAAAGANTQYDVKIKATMDKFIDKLITLEPGETIRQPVYDKDTNDFKDSVIEISPENLPAGPDFIIKYFNTIYENEHLAKQALKERGLKLFDAIIAAKDIDKSEEEVKQEWEAALQKAGISAEPQQQPPVKIPTQPQQPLAAVAKTQDELFADASKFNTPEEMFRLGNALLASQNTLKTDPNGTAKLQKAIEDMETRWATLVQYPRTQQAFKLLHSTLPNMLTAIQHEQG